MCLTRHTEYVSLNTLGRGQTAPITKCNVLNCTYNCCYNYRKLLKSPENYQKLTSTQYAFQHVIHAVRIV